MLKNEQAEPGRVESAGYAGEKIHIIIPAGIGIVIENHRGKAENMILLRNDAETCKRDFQLVKSRFAFFVPADGIFGTFEKFRIRTVIKNGDVFPCGECKGYIGIVGTSAFLPRAEGIGCGVECDLEDIPAATPGPECRLQCRSSFTAAKIYMCFPS